MSDRADQIETGIIVVIHHELADIADPTDMLDVVVGTLRGVMPLFVSLPDSAPADVAALNARMRSCKVEIDACIAEALRAKATIAQLRDDIARRN